MAKTDKSIAHRFSHPYVELALRLFLGGVFITSAVSKFPHHTEFEGIVKDYDLLPDALATVYAGALPWVEMLVGVYLLAGVLIRPAAIVSLLMALSFMIANVSALVDDKEHCGSCFGDMWTLPVWQAIAIDSGIFIVAGLLLFTGARAGAGIGIQRWLTAPPPAKRIQRRR